MPWWLHMNTLWYKLKNMTDIIYKKLQLKVLQGLLKTILKILYGKFACLHKTASRITGHLVCKIWLIRNCNVFSSITWFLSSKSCPILPFLLLSYSGSWCVTLADIMLIFYKLSSWVGEWFLLKFIVWLCCWISALNVISNIKISLKKKKKNTPHPKGLCGAMRSMSRVCVPLVL